MVEFGRFISEWVAPAVRLPPAPWRGWVQWPKRVQEHETEEDENADDDEWPEYDGAIYLGGSWWRRGCTWRGLLPPLRWLEITQDAAVPLASLQALVDELKLLLDAADRRHPRSVYFDALQMVHRHTGVVPTGTQGLPSLPHPWREGGGEDGTR